MASDGNSNPGQGAPVRAPAPAPGDDTYEDSPPSYDPLPPYSPTAPGATSDPTALAAAEANEKKKAPEGVRPFSSLNLTDEPLHMLTPGPDTCLAHLRLLYAFRRLREEVGYRDGLWGIADPGEDPKAPEVPLETLSKLREKRWAIYLARAVDRYEAWWKTLGGTGVTLGAMQVKGGDYEMFPFEDISGTTNYWNEDMLMPLGACARKPAV